MVIDYGGGVRAIDSHMHGRAGVTAVYCFPAPAPAIIDTAPATSLEAILTGLEELGIDDLAWIILTHIHLDHAGAAGHLAERFPRARVVVREEGAPHLIDPSRLWASASRLYDDMEGMWGSMRPVPADRLDVVGADGVVADLGDGRVLSAVYTPGHAAHHMALVEAASGDVFAGDALGVFLAEMGAVHPATPPPEFNLEAAVDSIGRLQALGPSRLFPTHFGPLPAAGAGLAPYLAEGASALRRVVTVAEAVVASGGGVAQIAEALEEEELRLVGPLDDALSDRLAHAIPHSLNAMGVARYLSKVRGMTVPK
ncbi:MAG TPA: MBL fold metallo-hydrolase [Actinomycetota bacterium]|nr:MBL fold metallo-hydrolase [Actinomycetota bacterium]